MINNYQNCQKLFQNCQTLLQLLKVVEMREKKYNKFVRNCQNCQTFSKLYKKLSTVFQIIMIVKFVSKIQNYKRLSRLSEIIKVVKNCLKCLGPTNGWSKVQTNGLSYVPKLKGHWVIKWVTQWQGHLSSCSDQLKKTMKKTKTIGEHLQNAILKDYDLWDI